MLDTPVIEAAVDDADISAAAETAEKVAARDRAARDLKLLAPYLPEGRIPDEATVHGNLRFWEVKEGEQTTKYAAGTLARPDLPKTDRDTKAQSAISKGTGFDAGHLIGHQFGGPEIPGNLSLQNPTMNQGGGNWYKMESQWAHDLRNDSRVTVVVKEVTRPDTPNFLWRSVESLTINSDGEVRHDEVSMLNPETERALAAQKRSPAPEVPGGAVVLDLNPTLALHERIGQDAEWAAKERLDNAQNLQSQPSGYKRVLAQLQSWRGQSVTEDKELEAIGTLGPGSEGKTPKELRAEQEAGEQLLKLRKNQLIPQIDKMTWTAHPKTGDVTYSLSGKAAFVDRGKAITVLQPDAAATRIALEMAVQKYGRSIDATGTPAFQKQLIQAAAQMKVDLVFTDPKVQARFVQVREEHRRNEEKLLAEAKQDLHVSPRAPFKKETEEEQQLRERQMYDRVAGKQPTAPESIVRDPERTFSKHADVLQQRYGFGLDATKADGIIALKMAQTGWQPEDVAAALKTRRLNTDLAAPEVHAYAEKLTVQAFGKAAREAAIERSTSSQMER